MGKQSLGERWSWWLLSVLVAGVGVSLVTSVLQEHTSWLWAATAAAAFAIAVGFTAPGGPLARSAERPTRLYSFAAYVMLAAFVGGSVMGTAAGWSVPVLLIASSCLAGAATTLLWPTLDAGVGAGEALVAVVCLLVGFAVLLSGVAVLRDSYTLFGVGFLLGGVAGLLSGVAFLRDSYTLAGVAVLLSGPALLASADSMLVGERRRGLGRKVWGWLMERPPVK